MSKATVDQLGVVHGKLCQWAMAKLDEEEPIMVMTPEGPAPTGLTRKAAKASDFAAIAKFLNDNNVTADIETNKGLSDLDKKLKGKGRRSDNVTPLPLPSSLPQLKAMRDGTN